MARIVSNKEVFFKVHGMEAFRSRGETPLRSRNTTEGTLGEFVNLYQGLDVEGIRLGRATALIRQSGGAFLKYSKDKRALSRLKGLLQEVLRYDAEHFSPGQRSIHNGLLRPEARAVFNGFDFNRHSAPGALLDTGSFRFDLKMNSLCIPDFSAARLLAEPPRVSQVQLRLLVSRVDFLLGDFITFMSPVVVADTVSTVQDLYLQTGSLPEGDGFLFVYLWLHFERDDAVAVPELLQRADDVFRIVCVNEA